ncbi:hypothetical protein B0T24DRAFT_275459 [Lasiosphaeria ovina]|uniref:Uncharacterized protein n=1 Tax=Lasiosphaeria ovina TaxID=92902 RepID=A0AAE0N862_9PEZI|nr:hypothetical protein B0T24DRAFT_275459 [Lasiosphaeria ovina]
MLLGWTVVGLCVWAGGWQSIRCAGERKTRATGTPGASKHTGSFTVSLSNCLHVFFAAACKCLCALRRGVDGSLYRDSGCSGSGCGVEKWVLCRPIQFVSVSLVPCSRLIGGGPTDKCLGEERRPTLGKGRE